MVRSVAGGQPLTAACLSPAAARRHSRHPYSIYANPPTDTNPGIDFTPAATPPAGASNNFVWVQTLSSLGAALTVNGSPETCTPSDGTNGLDSAYPYPVYANPPTDTEPTDSPAIALSSSATDETYNITANMYLLWRPGLPGDLLVPLGHVTWSAYGHAAITNGNWTVQGDSSASSPSFSASSAYPTWGTVIHSPQSWGCGTTSELAAAPVDDAFFRRFGHRSLPFRSARGWPPRKAQ